MFLRPPCCEKPFAMSPFPTVLALGLMLSGSLMAALTMGTSEPSEMPPIVADEANPARAAIDAFNAGRHIEAARLAKPLAEEGNAEALLIMGVAHEGEPSAEIAIEYLRKARDAGNWEATKRLVRLLVAQGEEDARVEARNLLESLAGQDRGAAARLLGEGSLRGWFGRAPDFEQTRQWWKQAAEKGDVEAMLSLGGLLDGSFGFPEHRDPAAALGWFLKAARLENPDAMVSAGSRLLNGEKSLRDEKEGRQWLAKAIARGQVDAWLALGDFEEMIRKDDPAAFASYSRGADAGQSGCMLKLAAFLAEGRGGQEKNPDQALRWLRKAGAAGNALGHYKAAAMLLDGEGRQILDGLGHLAAAAQSGVPGAARELGLLYLSDRLGIRDPTAAAGWFQRSAEAGDARGAYHFATLCEQGLGVTRNPVRAGQLYARASKAGHPQATSGLGRLHARGDGTTQNLPKAWALISLGVERGDKEAAQPLAELASQLTPEQLAAGRRLLDDFKKTSPEAPRSRD